MPCFDEIAIATREPTLLAKMWVRKREKERDAIMTGGKSEMPSMQKPARNVAAWSLSPSSNPSVIASSKWYHLSNSFWFLGFHGLFSIGYHYVWRLHDIGPDLCFQDISLSLGKEEQADKGQKDDCERKNESSMARGRMLMLWIAAIVLSRMDWPF